MLVFDLFDKSTFQNLDNWIKEVDQHARPNIQIIVIANKFDLVESSKKEPNSLENSAEKIIPPTPEEEKPQRQVSEEDILEFTKRTGLSIFEASAKTGNGVEPSFIALTDALIQEAKKNAPKAES